MKSIVQKIIFIRKKILIWILNLAEFRYFSGHWICTNDINNHSLVVDLGANKGAFSKKMVDEFKVTAFAIEANRRLCNEIKNDKIEVFNYAVTNADQLIDFYISDNDESSSIMEDFQGKWGNYEKITVEGITWKSLLKKLKLTERTIDILKIDIEGAELELIELMDKEDFNKIKQITIEYHDWLNSGLHERTVSCIRKLVKHGFLSYTDVPDHSWPVEMCFLNKKNMTFSLRQKVFLKIFNLITFLKY